MNQSTFRGRLAADPTFPAGKVETEGRQRWFSMKEVNTLRRKLSVRGRSLMPARPPGRAFRTAIANVKGGAGKSTAALHFAHAAALDGYRGAGGSRRRVRGGLPRGKIELPKSFRDTCP